MQNMAYIEKLVMDPFQRGGMGSKGERLERGNELGKPKWRWI